MYNLKTIEKNIMVINTQLIDVVAEVKDMNGLLKNLSETMIEFEGKLVKMAIAQKIREDDWLKS